MTSGFFELNLTGKAPAQTPSMCAQPDHDSPCDSRSAECQQHAHCASGSCSNGRLLSRETQPTSVLPVRLQCFLKIAAVLAVSHQLLDSGAHAASAERRADVLVYFNYPSRIWQTNPVTNDINTVKFTFETNINNPPQHIRQHIRKHIRQSILQHL